MTAARPSSRLAWGWLTAALLASSCSVIPHPPRSEGMVPPWRLPTADADTLSWNSLKGRAGVMIWIDPTCADVQDAAGAEGSLRLLESRWMEDPRVWLVYVASRPPKDEAFLDAPMLKAWLKEQKLRGQVVMDGKRELADYWRISRIPTASVVDATGKIRWSGSAELASDVFAYPDVSAALDSLLLGAAIPASQAAPSKGCPCGGWW